MNMDQKSNRGEVEFGINYENDMYGDVSFFFPLQFHYGVFPICK